MSDPSIGGQVAKLEQAIATHVKTTAIHAASKFAKSALPLSTWINYLKTSETTGHADELLDGANSAIIESLGCVALGLIRPALFALRGQIDLILAWLYFKDHPIEWDFVQRTGDGFMLKKTILTYLEINIENFSTRMKILQTAKSRKQDDPYRMLSAHVHSQTKLAMPIHGDLHTLVSSSTLCLQCAEVQHEVTEYLNDVLISYFAKKWASLPPSIVDAARKRSGSKFSSIFS